VLETLYLADDVYSDAEITEAVGTAEVKPPELELAHQIIDSLEGSFDPDTLTSTYRRDLKALLEAKLDGVELPPADEPEETAAPAVDLLEALRASVEAAKTPGATSAGAKSAAKAKKPAAKSRSRAAK
jgi:DNA end-binding protein Ku